jgi:hypothetical protein
MAAHIHVQSPQSGAALFPISLNNVPSNLFTQSIAAASMIALEMMTRLYNFGAAIIETTSKRNVLFS